MAGLKKKARFPFDLIRVSLPAFYDYYLKIKAAVTKENPIGVYVGICNKSEVNMYFDNCIAGGYTGWIQIKIFARPECSDYEKCAEEIIGHEVLHQVLDQVVGHEAKMSLDNIHKSLYCYDTNTKKWRFTVEFVTKKKNSTTIEIF